MVANTDTLAPAPTSVTAPSTSALLNLAAYMYVAYDTPYSSTSLETNINFAPLMSNGAPVVHIDNANGVYAEAFESTGPGSKQIVVAYEGTKSFFQGNQFTVGQLIDDTQLWGGKFADSFESSASFANQVISIAADLGIAKDKVFVTGHSLGAADAEYTASALGLGGAAFAGPGVNTAFTGSLSPTIIDYVDAGDPVGNYAADGNNVLAPVLVSDNIRHYGNLVVLPNIKGQIILEAASAAYASGGPRQKQAAFLGAIVAAGSNHKLSRYAGDLGVTLYLSDESESASSFFGATGAAGATGPQGIPGPKGTSSDAASVGIETVTAKQNPDGTTIFRFTGGNYFNGKSYSAVTDTRDAGLVNLLTETRDKNDGSHGTSIYQGGQTVQSNFFDTFHNGGAPDTTFVFNPGFGRDVVNLFRVDGDDHDTLSFKGSDYGNSIATVLNSARDTNAGLLITDPNASSPGGGPGTHDTLLLRGITKQQLAQNQGDIAFHA